MTAKVFFGSVINSGLVGLLAPPVFFSSPLDSVKGLACIAAVAVGNILIAGGRRP
jgi:hypothetical protein